VLTLGTPLVTGSVAFLPSAFSYYRSRRALLQTWMLSVLTLGTPLVTVGHCLRYLVNILRPHIQSVPFNCMGKAGLVVVTTA